MDSTNYTEDQKLKFGDRVKLSYGDRIGKVIATNYDEEFDSVDKNGIAVLFSKRNDHPICDDRLKLSQSDRLQFSLSWLYHNSLTKC